VNRYKVRTRLGINWVRSASGEWYGVDRGAATDIYESEVEMRGIEGRIDQFIKEAWDARAAGNNTFTLTGFYDNERIFGSDINYATVTAVMLNTPMKEQIGWKVFSTKFTLRAIGPTFSGTAAMPALSYIDRGWFGNPEEWTISKLDTYNNTYTYLDHQINVGQLRIGALLTQSEMANLRRYAATLRAGAFLMSQPGGVTLPFGPAGTGYQNVWDAYVKIKEIANEEMWGLNNWKCDITFVEHYS
jgi:hypothetical protein